MKNEEYENECEELENEILEEIGENPFKTYKVQFPYQVRFVLDDDENTEIVISTKVKNGLDTVSSSGWMMMKLIGVLEEWNREMLVERTNAGLARTVANGTKLGRKSVLTPSIKRNILDAKVNGLSIRKIANEVGINRGAVQRFLQVA